MARQDRRLPPRRPALPDENTRYRLEAASGTSLVRLGSELTEGVRLDAGDRTIESLGPPPHGPAAER